MSSRQFGTLSLGMGLVFAIFFAVYVLPPALESGDLVGAFAAGFVNPFSTGYSVDTILCGVILIVWIIYEKFALKVRNGWICILLSIVPGVATGFGLYLFLRTRQLNVGQAT